MTIIIDELQALALKTITRELNPDTREILNHLSYSDPEFEQGFIQGMVWLSILAITCNSKKLTPEDDSQRVIAALEDEGYLSEEDEKSYTEAINKLYKPIGVNINDLIADEH